MAKNICKAKSSENRLRNREKRIRSRSRKNAAAPKKEWRNDGIVNTLANQRQRATPLHKRTCLNLLGL